MENIYVELQKVIKEFKTAYTGIPVAFEHTAIDQFFSDEALPENSENYFQGSSQNLDDLKTGMIHMIACLKAQDSVYKTLCKTSNQTTKYLFSRLSENTSTEIKHLQNRAASYLGIKISEIDLTPKINKLANKWAEIECPYESILSSEKYLQRCANTLLEKLSNLDTLSLGLDDFIKTIQVAHNNNIQIVETKIANKGSVKKASQHTKKIASMDDLKQYIRVGSDILIHKCKNDLWKLSKDADGNDIIEKMYDEDILKY